MYQNYAKLLSVLLLIGYLYYLTKNKMLLWIFYYSAYIIAAICFFKVLFPDIKFFSPSIEYMLFLMAVGVPFLALILLMFWEAEKQKTSNKEHEQYILKLFRLTAGNIMFWIVIVTINVVCIYLDKLR